MSGAPKLRAALKATVATKRRVGVLGEFYAPLDAASVVGESRPFIGQHVGSR